MTMTPVAITLVSFIGVNMTLVGLFLVNRIVERFSRVEA